MWEMVGAVGEIAGALAVVASLVYLARQVALSNRLAKAEATRAPTSDLNNLNAVFGTDPVFCRAFLKVVGDGATPSDLSPEEAQVVELYLISVMNLCGQLFREVRQGVLDEEILTEFSDPIFPSVPFIRANWARSRRGLPASFVEFLEQRYDLSAPTSPSDEVHSEPWPKLGAEASRPEENGGQSSDGDT